MTKAGDLHWWSSPVCVLTLKLGVKRNVSHVEAAAEHLIQEWPGDRGPAHQAACEACLAVLGGEQGAEYARRPFIEAAREADILVKEGR